jgi:formyl-CoA transferase
MKELAEDKSLFATGTMVEVDHPKRGRYLSVGNPIKLSDSPAEVKRSPLLGEHTEEVLRELGYASEDIGALKTSGAIEPVKKVAAE